MKPYRLLAVGLRLAALTPSLAMPGLLLAGCAAEEQEGEEAQFPKAPIGSDSPEQLASLPPAPGEAPTPISTVPVASPPPPPMAALSPEPVPPPPQEIVPGSTTEEEYEARAGDVNVGADENEYTDTDPSALTDFRQTLDPYGSWVDDPNYGTVWTPSPSVVGDDFAPYVSAGQWTYDDAQNWVWVSDYDWGWAPFHYGRWAYLGSRWGWIPGREYAGAWVSWRTGYGGGWDDYLGWAPLPPRWGWRNGLAFGYGFAPQSPFVFCHGNDVFNPGLRGRIVSGGQVAAVGAHTRTFAAPSVGGPGGRVVAHPTVGPPPASIGISPNRIAHLPVNNRGILHAQQFARPVTAQSLGAHAAMVSPRAYAQVAPRAGLTGYGRYDAVARAPQYRGIAPTPYRFPSHSLGPIPSYGYGGAAHYGPTYSAGRYSAPSYGGAPYGGAYGGFRGGVGGTVHAKPGSSSTSSYEDPGVPVHRSVSGGGFRGGGGGFRGGGGGMGHGGGHR